MGVKLPVAEQLAVEADMVYPLLHVGAHVEPPSCVELHVPIPPLAGACTLKQVIAAVMDTATISMVEKDRPAAVFMLTMFALMDARLVMDVTAALKLASARRVW